MKMLSRRLFTVAVATASIVSLELLSAPVMAQVFKYVPPTSRGIFLRTTGGGARGGCLNSTPASITLLVPNNHVAQTAQERPTFSWYVSNPTSGAVPMEFALVEPGVASPLFVKSLKADKTGLVQLELPKNAPSLQPGREYRWAVSITCNAQRPSENVYVMGWVKRVAATANQAKAIAQAGSDNQRAGVYAQSGLWYDALTAISKSVQANPQDSSTFESFVSLLDEVGLTEVATQERQRLSRK